ncbi:MAG: hypothetical protein HY735_30395 [Verrucomicrobia bacterium]|nr:hypothetical protein [Verrucomicrobiota bacterium]
MNRLPKTPSHCFNAVARSASGVYRRVARLFRNAWTSAFISSGKTAYLGPAFLGQDRSSRKPVRGLLRFLFLLVYLGNLTAFTQAQPTIQLTSDQPEYLAPATIRLTAELTGGNGVLSKASFFRNSASGKPEPLGETSSAPFTFVWSNVTGGSYTLTAIATDDQGRPAQSNPVMVQVWNLQFPPKLQWDVPEPPAGRQIISLRGIYVVGAPLRNPAVVHYFARPFTALEGIDYELAPGTWEFVPGGHSTTNLDLEIYGNELDDPNREFEIILSSTNQVLLASTNLVVTIHDDDDPPRLSISNLDVRIREDSPGTNAWITLNLDHASNKRVEVAFSTSSTSPVSSPDAAVAERDYVPLNRLDDFVIFQPGQTQSVLTNKIKVIDNSWDELDRSFLVHVIVDRAFAIPPTNNQVRVTIKDDDDPPTILVTPPKEIIEGAEGTLTKAVFTVSLSSPSGLEVRVPYETTSNGNATPGVDFKPTRGILTFSSWQTNKTFEVEVIGDDIKERTETFSVSFSAPMNASLSRGEVDGVIFDDDEAPVLVIENAEPVREGDFGTTNAVFRVLLSKASDQTISVNFATSNGTATEGSDFEPISETLTFSPGQRTTNVVVKVTGDPFYEADETFFVTLFDPKPIGAVNPGQLQATGTILNDDLKPSLSVSSLDVRMDEGGSGTNIAIIALKLEPPSGAPVKVGLTTTNDTASPNPASPGKDYNSLNPSVDYVTFQPGDSQIILTNYLTRPSQPKLFIDNDFDEPDRTFLVRLSVADTNLVTLDPSQSQIRVTIVDDDPPPIISIESAPVTPGKIGMTTAIFSIKLSAPSAFPVIATYATVGDTAREEIDYLGTSGPLSFAPMQRSTNLIVLVKPQTINQPIKSFFLELTNVVNATPPNLKATGTILPGVAPPTLSISDARVTALSNGTANALFVVKLSSPSGQTVTMNYSTEDDTAKAGTDYETSQRTLTFTPGQYETNLVVAVRPQFVNEPIKSFLVTLTNVVNATPQIFKGTGTILPALPPPTLFIRNEKVMALSSTTNSVVFTVSLSAPSGQTILADYATVDDTARGGVDYVASAGPLSFDPGKTNASVTVGVNPQTTKQPPKSFLVILTNVVNASLPKTPAIGTIVPLPRISIQGEEVQEGKDNAITASFAVVLSAASETNVTVNFATADGTALANFDYLGTTNTLTFDPGVTNKTISVLVYGDLLDEPNETFFVNLSNPSNAAIEVGQGKAVIINDDEPPVVSIGDVSVTEGHSGTTAVLFPVTLSAPSGQPVTVNYATANDTAVAGKDYQATTGTLDFIPPETQKVIAVVINGDTLPEGQESFFVNLSSPTNAILGTLRQGRVLINDDDPPPRIKITGVEVPEVDTGSSKAVFQVNLSIPSEQTVTVDFATTNGTALAISDYLPLADTLKFAPGETDKLVTVLVNGDVLNEADEDFFVLLRNPLNAEIEVEKGRALIRNNDALPALSINDIPVNEGDSGLAGAVFSVALSPASGRQVTVNFATTDGTASEASDYVAQSGQLAFKPGETNQTISLFVNGDTFYELDEAFFVTLSEPVHAGLAKGSGRATIIDDDAQPALTIEDVSITEGNAAATEAVFTVRLSVPSPKTVKVDFAASGETASPGLDYEEISGPLVFAVGETEKLVAVKIYGDSLDEIPETFVVNLLKPENATIANGRARGTIFDDDDPPSVSVNDVTVFEGRSSAANAAFTVSLSAASSLRVSVAFATTNGTAAAYSDYTPNSGLLIFDPGVTNQPVAVEVLGDLMSEPDEDFFVDLISPMNARLGKSQGRGTIRDDDDLPEISVKNVSIRVGEADTAKVLFTLSLSAQSGRTVSVLFATANGSAIAGSDYIAQSGMRVFEPGETSKTISVTILGNTLRQPGQTFLLNLSQPVNATLKAGQDKATGTIIVDGPMPNVSISGWAVTEGNSGTVNAVLAVNLSRPSTQVVSVRYATVDGTALAGSDYDAIPSTLLTFNSGETNRPIIVAIRGDTVPELKENFWVVLSDSVNATVFDNRAIVTITDDDTPVVISITDAPVTEPDTGTTDMVFNVSLSSPSSQLVTVAYATLDNTARAGADYASTSGMLTFVPGTTNQTIVVQVKGDTANEDPESFFVRLSEPKNAEILDDRAIGTITDNDRPPTVSISDAAVTEGQSGTVSADFTVSLSSASSKFVSVDLVTVEETATAGKDYQSITNALTFIPDETSRTVSVLVNGDTEAEPNESFSVVLSSPLNATLGSPRGLGTIIDDDVPPTLLITDASLREGNSGTSFMEFTVHLSVPITQTVTVNYTTADRTAMAGSDYTRTTGKLIFAPGVITNSFPVPILGDATKEPNETFEVRLSNPIHARLIRNVALGTILDDDVLPTLTITDTVVAEGNSGVANAVFVARLSTPSAQTITVGFQTAGGTATSGSDFKALSGTLEFAPGTDTRNISVEVIGDLAFEPDETFFVNLANPLNAVIADGQGQGTILNDDSPANTPPTVRIINPASGTAFTAPAEVTISVDAFDRDGVVRRVEFFVGSTLLGSVSGPPFNMVWQNEAAGAYSLTARAVDDKGEIGISAAANILVSRRAAGAEVAIVRNFADPEIALIQNYLLEMGISSQVFEQEGLSFEAIRDARLVIWNDLGSTVQGLNDREVTIFRQAFGADIPLYFMGETLAVSTRNLSPALEAQWTSLIHLGPGAANRSDGTMTIDGASKHPVVAGHFGPVGRFSCPAGAEGKLLPTSGVTLLGRSGSADLIVAYQDPSFEEGVRTVTQNCRLAADSNAGGLTEQKKLFKNAVAWLMRRSFQALTDLSVTVEGPAGPVPAGKELTYEIAFQHQGEIEGTGAIATISLAPELKYVRSDFVQGTLIETNGVVTYTLGNMASAQRSILNLVLLPTAGGSLKTEINVAGNEPDPNSLNNTTTFETLVTGVPSSPPVVQPLGAGPSGFQLRINGATLGSFRVQSSADLVRWIDLTNFTGRTSPVLVTDPAASRSNLRFYRVVSP